MDQTRPFLTRVFRVRKGAEKAAKLSVVMKMPVKVGAHYEAEVEISSPYFSDTFKMGGVDELQAFGCLFAPIRATLDRAMEIEGLEIYKFEPGDLAGDGFWGFSLSPPTRD